MKRSHKYSSACLLNDFETIVLDSLAIGFIMLFHPSPSKSALGIDAAICYYSSSAVLKFLQLTDLSQTIRAPNGTAIPKVGLETTVC